METLRTLLDDTGRGLPLPAALTEQYDGPLDLGKSAVYSNFVTSLDGVVALGVAGVSSGAAISGRNPSDRFVMGLLRACASCVLVGASTVRDEPGILWDADFVAPARRDDWAELRRSLGLEPQVLTVIVTASGELDLSQPVFERRALVCTTAAGAARIGDPPAGTEVAVFEGERLDMRRVVGALRERGHHRILTEGGPTLIGALLEHRLLDTAFLTLSPVVAGRRRRARAGMVQGIELLPGPAVWGRLRTLKVARSHLFLRYDLDGEAGG